MVGQTQKCMNTSICKDLVIIKFSHYLGKARLLGRHTVKYWHSYLFEMFSGFFVGSPPTGRWSWSMKYLLETYSEGPQMYRKESWNENDHLLTRLFVSVVSGDSILSLPSQRPWTHPHSICTFMSSFFHSLLSPHLLSLGSVTFEGHPHFLNSVSEYLLSSAMLKGTEGSLSELCGGSFWKKRYPTFS